MLHERAVIVAIIKSIRWHVWHVWYLLLNLFNGKHCKLSPDSVAAVCVSTWDDRLMYDNTWNVYERSKCTNRTIDECRTHESNNVEEYSINGDLWVCDAADEDNDDDAQRDDDDDDDEKQDTDDDDGDDERGGRGEVSNVFDECTGERVTFPRLARVAIWSVLWLTLSLIVSMCPLMLWCWWCFKMHTWRALTYARCERWRCLYQCTRLCVQWMIRLFTKNHSSEVKDVVTDVFTDSVRCLRLMVQVMSIVHSSLAHFLCVCGDGGRPLYSLLVLQLYLFSLFFYSHCEQWTVFSLHTGFSSRVMPVISCALRSHSLMRVVKEKLRDADTQVDTCKERERERERG